MAVNIEVNYEDLEKLGSRFSQSYDRWQQFIQLVKTRVNHVYATWEGKGSDMFEHEMETLVLPATQRLSNALHAGEDTCKKIGQQFQDSEEEAGNLFKVMDGADSTWNIQAGAVAGPGMQVSGLQQGLGSNQGAFQKFGGTGDSSGGSGQKFSGTGDGADQKFGGASDNSGGSGQKLSGTGDVIKQNFGGASDDGGSSGNKFANSGDDDGGSGKKFGGNDDASGGSGQKFTGSGNADFQKFSQAGMGTFQKFGGTGESSAGSDSKFGTGNQDDGGSGQKFGNSESTGTGAGGSSGGSGGNSGNHLEETLRSVLQQEHDAQSGIIDNLK